MSYKDFVKDTDETILKEVKKIAERQFDDQDREDNIGFDCGGQFIVNPWIDNTGRFLLTTEEAIEYYGAINVHNFIEDIVDCYDLEV